MLKKIVLLALILLPLGAFAQEKIAYFSPAEVIVIMPQYKQMQDSLQKMQVANEKEMEVMQEDYKRKYDAFMKESDTLTENIKIRRMQEIQDIENRASQFFEFAQKQLSEAQQALLAPIHQKLRDAIQAVGKANNFLYILDASSVVLYMSPSAVDATPLIQKQLGL